jgi:tripartite-type tricarboxylate transporter receptor subunit TctC
MTVRRLTLAAVTLAALGLGASAQSGYPSKPVTLIVPIPAGTGMDTLARLYAEPLGQALGKPVVIENKPGAALMLGTAAVAAAAPDGHTIGISTATPMAAYHVLYKKISYDPTKDFAPIYFYVKSPFVLVVNPELPVKSVPELIKYAKESGKPLNYSSAGVGSSQHLSMEYMAQRFGLKMTHVPYRLSTQGITDIAAGHVNLGFAEAGASLPLIREGKLRALASAGASRIAALPDVPTMAEAGFPGVEVGSGVGLVAPAGTPPGVIDTLHRATADIIATPGFKERMAAIGVDTVGSTPQDYARIIRDEYAKWGKVVQAAGIKPE